MEEMKCPFTGKVRKDTSDEKGIASEGNSNKDWWPNQLNLKLLSQNCKTVSPMDADFNYGAEFSKLDLCEIKKDIKTLMNTSQEWWPADYGHYGPFFIRMAWHSAGTYRTGDGRGGANVGNQRFAPINSWPDNVNLDKARRLLWPIKQQYGNKISWADLMILAGNCAFESMGLEMVGFSGGRVDIWEPEEDTYWGKEKEWLDDNRHEGKGLEDPLAAVQMGLIYVNPEGPNGEPNAIESAKDIRETFERMGMDDEETVALVAGGHTFGKCHGAGDATHVGAEPEAASVEKMGFGWISSHGSGKGEDTISSGIEGAWTPNPIKWDTGYFETLLGFDWNLVKSPAGAFQWMPTDPKAKELVPDAHNPSKTHAPMMTTADLALRMDPVYLEISKRFHENHDEFEKVFANAWFKLTHRDMGPKTRYLGAEAPKEDFLWQDAFPKADYDSIDENDVKELKAKIKDTGLSVSELISTAWASAVTFRGSDFRGGANGARLRLAPQKYWEVNEPGKLERKILKLEKVVEEFNSKQSSKKVSLADIIVLAGNVGIEIAAEKSGICLEVPFTKGRTDATAEQTDVKSFEVLEPVADAFRNYLKDDYSVSAEELMVDKAQLLNLTAPELTVLLGGLRVLGINYKESKSGVLTDNVGVLSNDFFINLLDMATEWKKNENDENLFVGVDRKTREEKWTATRVDLIFGSNTQLRAIAEIYASSDSKEKFLKDFVNAWNKVMNADRFDIKKDKI
ncbi:catalase/peroxidase HPI [uncultured Clostridium sp.]|uniref:catalase/peroxidase HPI n=1 Tax=uncultured Clostridium sp. TaxID=59620 RepID=UPI00263785CC|nr:catalase/peroxidase HPI [uncultured Clostridium sp.]